MGCCDRAENCAFFREGKASLSIRQYEFLIVTYCEGKLQERCKRRQWQVEKNEIPPENLLPNGYYSTVAIPPG